MLEGLIQDDHPLTLQFVLQRMRTVHGRHAEVVDANTGERRSFAEVGERVDRLAAGLASLGVEQGDRVGTLLWNTPEHFEAYFAIPAMGAVLHTVNQRLFEDQLEYVINHAEDKVLLVEDILVPLVEKIFDRLTTVEHYVVVGQGGTGSLRPVSRYEELLAAGDGSFDYPEIVNDRQASALAYTSGTTGEPKGVLYSHRHNVLQAVVECMVDTFGIRESDRILQTVPLFHAIGWCLPYAAGLAGASMVMPGHEFGAEKLCKFIESERITFTAGVPTVLTDILNYADEHGPNLRTLRRVISGGSSVPLSLMKALRDRHGMPVTQAYGMTESGPPAGVAVPPGEISEEDVWEYRQKAARVYPLIDYRLVDVDDNEVPWDGETSGQLEMRGPFTVRAYYKDDASADRFHDGWLRTGDLLTIDGAGYLEVTDRVKDVIKSGGEWISSVDLENQLTAHDDVAEAAVIAMHHPRWHERPLACIVAREGSSPDPSVLRDHLAGRVSKIWLPDAFAFISAIPRTGTGKFDKKALRASLEAGDLELHDVTGQWGGTT